ncbi:UNVERIFIED_CONTAM: hypothetical protein RMT77_005565 [Armadillidium vulgare]
MNISRQLVNPMLWSGGPVPGEFYEFPRISRKTESDPLKHTLYPSTSGTSVVGFIYKDGVMIAADTKGSYGSLSRFMDIDRLFKATDQAVLACGGDIADYQFIKDVIEQKVRDDECAGSMKVLDAGSLHCWLTRVLYNRRTRFDPLWLDCVVAGFKAGKPFLGFVNKIGMAYEADEIASGFGVHFSLPMIRDARDKKSELTREEARKLMRECMKILYYRDCKAHHKYQIADITAEGVKIDVCDFKKETNWDVAFYGN